jgi:NADH-quinone oxidoreductase subunit L
MTVPNVILAILAVLAGFVAFDQVGEALGFPGGIGKFVYLGEPEAFKFHADVAAVSIIAALAGVAGGFYFWWGEARPAKTAGARFPLVYALWKNKYYMDDLYQLLIDRVVLAFGRFIAWWDRNIVNDTGVDGSAALTVYSGFRLKFIQTGRLPNYAFAIILGVVAMAIIAMTVLV